MSDCSKRELIKLFNHGCNFALLLERRVVPVVFEDLVQTHKGTSPQNRSAIETCQSTGNTQ
jgi:hypothetical protein